MAAEEIGKFRSEMQREREAVSQEAATLRSVVETQNKVGCPRAVQYASWAVGYTPQRCGGVGCTRGGVRVSSGDYRRAGQRMWRNMGQLGDGDT